MLIDSPEKHHLAESPRRRTSVSVTCASLLVGLLLTACAHQQVIGDTKIPDTPRNRQVLEVVEQYRQAMESEKAAAVLMLVHPSYRDDSGTPDPQDDIDYEKLKRNLKGLFERTDRVRYRIEYQNIEFHQGDAWVDVWIDATFVYRHPKLLPRYRRFTDYHRYRLVAWNKTWRFISGL